MSEPLFSVSRQRRINDFDPSVSMDQSRFLPRGRIRVEASQSLRRPASPPCRPHVPPRHLRSCHSPSTHRPHYLPMAGSESPTRALPQPAARPGNTTHPPPDHSPHARSRPIQPPPLAPNAPPPTASRATCLWQVVDSPPPPQTMHVSDSRPQATPRATASHRIQSHHACSQLPTSHRRLAALRAYGR